VPPLQSYDPACGLSLQDPAAGLHTKYSIKEIFLTKAYSKTNFQRWLKLYHCNGGKRYSNNYATTEYTSFMQFK
jgi:hypothetical protein